jgi:hypothetical protein
MWVTVEFTHRQGVKLPRGQQHPRGRLAGEIVTYTLGQSLVDAISLKLSPHTGPDLAVMYRPRLVGVGREVMRIAGLERYGAPPAWTHQEWICHLTPRPADVPGEPSRVRRP